ALRRLPWRRRAVGRVASAGDPARGGVRGAPCRGTRASGPARPVRRLGGRRAPLDRAAVHAGTRLGRGPRLGGTARLPRGYTTARRANALSVVSVTSPIPPRSRAR